MHIARTWVFPIARIVIAVVIAAALVQLDFFSGGADAEESATPTGSLGQPETLVQRADVENTVRLDATVAADEAVPVLATVRNAAGRTAEVTAPIGGTLVQLDLLVDRPDRGVVAVAGGPQPFECTGLRIDVTTPGAEAAGVVETTVRCAVPAEVVVLAGLTAELEITAGSAQDVLVAPTTAVEGSVGAGAVSLPGDGEEPEERAVTLGITDGLVVGIVHGLEEGGPVLAFAPTATANGAVDGLCSPDAGGMVCP